jgi:hypothetical protein
MPELRALLITASRSLLNCLKSRWQCESIAPEMGSFGDQIPPDWLVSPWGFYLFWYGRLLVVPNVSGLHNRQANLSAIHAESAARLLPGGDGQRGAIQWSGMIRERLSKVNYY